MNTRRLAIAVLVFAGASVPVFSAELVRFKSGFEMTAHAIRYEGDMAILTLDGGSEVGFPKSVLDLVKIDETVPGEVYKMTGRNKVQRHFMANGVALGAGPIAPQPSNRPDKDQGSGTPQEKVLLSEVNTSEIGPGGLNVGFTYDGKSGRTGANAKVNLNAESELVMDRPSLIASPGGKPQPTMRRLTPSMLPELARQFK